MNKTIQLSITLTKICDDPEIYVDKLTKICFDDENKAFARLVDSKEFTLTALSSKDKEWLEHHNLEYKEIMGCPCCKGCSHELAIGLMVCDKCKWETPYYNNVWCSFTCNKCQNKIDNKSHNENGFICNGEMCTYEEKNIEDKNNYVEDSESLFIKDSSKKNPLMLVFAHCVQKFIKKGNEHSKKVVTVSCELCKKKNKNISEIWCSFRCMYCKGWNVNDKHNHNEELDKALHNQIELLK